MAQLSTKSLSPNCRKAYKYIKKYISLHGYAPSVRDIAKAIGVSSSSTCHGYLKQLETLGLVIRDPARPRALILSDTPLEDMELFEDYTFEADSSKNSEAVKNNLDKVVPADDLSGFKSDSRKPDLGPIQLPEDAFTYVMPDEAMLNINVLPGDILIMEPLIVDLKDGDHILVDYYGYEFVRTYYKGVKKVSLQPQNMFFDAISCDPGEFSVKGRIVGIYRSYKSK